MPIYKLGTVKKKEFKEINLDGIIELKNNGLEKLDKYTMKLFNNESELKAYLFSKKLITEDDYKKDIKVIYKHITDKKLDVIYSDMAPYFDYTYLQAQLEMLSRSDIAFLEKLRDHYSNGNTSYNKQATNVSDISLYLSDVRNGDGKPFESKLLDNAISDLFVKAISRGVDENTGEFKDDYRGYRDLALFIYKYNKKKEKIKEKQVETTKQIVIDEVKEPVKEKTACIKAPFAPKPLEGEQFSLFNKGHVEVMKKEEAKQKTIKMFTDLGKRAVQGNK